VRLSGSSGVFGRHGFAQCGKQEQSAGLGIYPVRFGRVGAQRSLDHSGLALLSGRPSDLGNPGLRRRNKDGTADGHRRGDGPTAGPSRPTNRLVSFAIQSREPPGFLRRDWVRSAIFFHRPRAPSARQARSAAIPRARTTAGLARSDSCLVPKRTDGSRLAVFCMAIRVVRAKESWLTGATGQERQPVPETKSLASPRNFINGGEEGSAASRPAVGTSRLTYESRIASVVDALGPLQPVLAWPACRMGRVISSMPRSGCPRWSVTSITSFGLPPLSGPARPEICSPWVV
jgi:hypothetical protein